MSVEHHKKIDECIWAYNDKYVFENFAIFGMAFTVLLGTLWQICRIQHGTRPISSLTLRPWRVVLICLITVSAQAISNGKGI